MKIEIYATMEDIEKITGLIVNLAAQKVEAKTRYYEEIRDLFRGIASALIESMPKSDNKD